MTNDTSTLTGALKEAGETLAANLTTQGVPSTWDEGLATLIGKVLDITPGPTPSFDGITLSGDKSILSAADSEYCVLTAQLTDGGSAAAVSGETVTFTVYKSSDDSVVTTLTADTNSSGLATVSYYGQGTGDIYIQAECTFVSEIYEVEDCFRFDSASSDNTSKYSSVNLNSLSWDTDHYVATRTLTGSSSSTYYSQIYIDETLPVNYEISLDIWASNVREIQSGICISDSHPQTYSGTNQAMVVYQGSQKGLMYRVNGTLTRYDNSPSLERETWFNFSMKVNGTSVTAVIKDSNNSTVYSVTQTLGNIQSWKKWNIQLGNSSHTIHWKNLKVKAL